MNLERLDKHFIPVLDLEARCTFKTQTSVGFDLGRHIPGYFEVIGDIQIHHPCVGHIKAFTYIHLPASYRNIRIIIQIQETIFSALGIPSDETYELTFYDAKDCIMTAQHVDRNGLSDGA